MMRPIHLDGSGSLKVVRALLLGCTLAAPFSTSCSSVPADDYIIATCPQDNGDFAKVSAVVELRCGSLDCHGNTERPMRIYSQYGLRKPETPQTWDTGFGSYADYYPGGAVPTTERELTANLQAICGLEPEKMTRVVTESNVDPGTLTFVRKPRLQEKHKGGRVWDAASAGDQCMTNWLKGRNDTALCDVELAHR